MEGYHDQYKVTEPQFVSIEDVVGDNGEVDYGKLNGKVLIVQYIGYISDDRDNYLCSPTNIPFNYKNQIKINVKNRNFKICVNGKLEDYGRWQEKSSKILFPILFACNITDVQFQDQIITFNDYLLLVASGTLKEICFITTEVIDKNNKYVPLEKLCEHLLNIEKIYMYYTADEGTVESIRHAFSTTDNTSQALLDLPCFNKLKEFHLLAVPLETTFKTFAKFMKKHAFANFDITLLCVNQEHRLTSALKTELEEIKKDLIETWPTNSKPKIIF